MTAEIVLVKVTGQDRPGVAAALLDAIGEQDLRVLDVGQGSIHNMFTMGLLLHVPRASERSLADLAERAQGLGLHVDFEPVTAEAYSDWVSQQGKPRHIVTLLGKDISAAGLAAVSRAIARHGLNIDDMVRLSGRIPLDDTAPHPYAVIECSVRGVPRDTDGLRRAFLELAQQHMLDIAFQKDDIFRRNRRLVAFDMDSTLIKVEVINELAAAAGVGEEVAAITESAMRGELDFDASFRKRLGLLNGLDESVLQEIADRLPLTEGAERLFKILRQLGFKTAIISGGFQYFGRHLQKLLEVDYVLANELEVIDGKVTGRVAGEIVNGERKAAFLQEIARRENIRLEQVIAVGDGANDLPMLRLAGMGIAFRAKPIVRESAGNALTLSGLDAILYLIGVRDRETMALLEGLGVGG